MFSECGNCGIIENIFNLVGNEKNFPESRMKFVEVVKMKVDCRRIVSHKIEMKVENTFRFSLPGARGNIDVLGGTLENYEPVDCPRFRFLGGGMW